MSYATCSVVGQMGRLGNQLFQVATTIAYALDNGQEYFFPQWDYQEYVKLPIGATVSYYQPVNEINLRYHELPKHSGNVNLHGHFLSTKYFQHRRRELIRLFKPLYPEGVIHKTKRSGCLPTHFPSCAIHVRRGDYLNEEQKGHGLMGMDYYESAINIMLDKNPDMVFYICSDDIPWCMQNFNIKANYVHHAVDMEDLLFMSNCDNQIISNSTFGWWAAWLNTNRNKTVVAPRQWFKDTEGWDDLYEPNWTVI